MSQDGPRANGGSAHPLLFECDRSGAVMWMSAAARDRLGEVKIVGQLAVEPSPGTIEVRFTRVAEWRDRVLIHAEVHGGRMSPDTAALFGLLRLQSSMLQHYLRLHGAQTRLAGRVRRGQRGNGAKLVELLDLDRQRLGRELHTGVGQALAAIRLQLEIIDGRLEAPPPSVRTALDRISGLAGEALDQVRSVSHRLHPPDWQRLPLPEALRREWERSGIPERFEGVLELEAMEGDLPHAVKVLLYRAAQEAQSNIIRHSGATRVATRLRREGDRVVLTVEDNGRGIGTGQPGDGIGLRSIREQASELGGSFSIRSGPEGTTFEVTLPVTLPGAG